jgi:hypothetical protein
MTGYRIKQTVLIILGWIFWIAHYAALSEARKTAAEFFFCSAWGVGTGLLISAVTGGDIDPRDGSKTGYRIKQTVLMTVGFFAAMLVYGTMVSSDSRSEFGVLSSLALGIASGWLLAYITGGETD